MMERRHFMLGLGGLALIPPHVRAAEAGTAYDWKTIPFGAGGFIDGFVFHPREKDLLYARTDIGGAYRFDATNKSWVPMLDFLGKSDGDLMGVLAIAVDPSDPDRVYAACGIYTGEWARKAAVLASKDRGATWQVNDLTFKLGGNQAGRGTGERLQVDPNQGETLWLGSTQDGLWKSNDRGITFASAPLAVKHVSMVAIDPTSGKPGQASRTIYAGSHDQPGLYVSRDGGATFAREPGTPAQVPQRAAFGPDGSLYVTFARGDKAFATNPGNATEGGVWKRNRAGAWTEITPVKPGRGDASGFGYSGIDVQGGRIIVSTIERWTEGDDLFLSTDDGVSWKALGARSRHDAKPYPWLVNYMQGKDKMGHWLADVKLDPFNPQRAIYGTGYGLWISRNLGAAQVDWDFTVANFEETATLDIKSPSGGATLLAAMGDVSGAAWDDVSKTPTLGLFTPTFQTNRSVDFAQARPGIIARTADQASTGGYVSTDGSLSWKPFGASARDPKKPAGDVAVSAKGGAIVWAPEKQGALVSHDLGKSWQAVDGWPATREHRLVPVADRAVESVFHLFDPATGSLLVSADGGRSFKTSVTGLTQPRQDQHAMLISSASGVRDLWLALPDALLHFPGVDVPMKQSKVVTEAWLIAVGKGPAEGTQSVYLWGKVWMNGALVEGIFRSDDGGTGFVRINDDAHRYGYLLSMAADPLEHGTVYVAAHGRGVLVGKPR